MLVFERSSWSLSSTAVPWEDKHMKIGSSFDLHKQQSLRSRFWLCHPPTDLPGTDLHTLNISSMILRDEEILLQCMDSDTRALASVFTVFNLKASLETLKTALCSKTSMTVMERCTITLPAEHLEHLLELSDEAESYFGQLNWYEEYNARTSTHREQTVQIRQLQLRSFPSPILPKSLYSNSSSQAKP
jgi:hypothetical protein